jgi:hypothetical protein
MSRNTYSLPVYDYTMAWLYADGEVITRSSHEHSGMAKYVNCSIEHLDSDRTMRRLARAQNSKYLGLSCI